MTSYTGGVLTLTLNNGSTVSGMVTSATQIECEMATSTPVANIADHGNHDQNDNDQNDNRGDQNDDRNEAPVCDSSVLVPGAVVHEVELRIDSAGARFTSVEISR